MIQSNQPGTIYYTTIDGKNTTTGIYSEEMTITNNTKLHTYTKYVTTSKTIEYTIQNQTQTIMNFSYTIKIPNNYVAHDIRYNTYDDDNIIRINTSSTQYTTMENIIIYFYDNSIENTTETTINQPGILIKPGDNLEITYYTYTYGDITKINVLYSSLFIPNLEDIRLFVNYNSLPFLSIYSYNNQNETIETIFKTNANIVEKNQTLTFTPRYAIGCDEYDLLQTYVLTNEIITPQILNQTIEEIENDLNYSDPFLIVPQYRTVMEAMNTLMLSQLNAIFISERLNSTSFITEEVLCMAGIENNRMNYIHFTNPLFGMKIFNDSLEKNGIYNLYVSMNSYQHAKFSLNLNNYDCAYTTLDEILGLIDLYSNLNFLLDNETKLISLYPSITNNVSIILDTETYILWSIIRINGFEYIGAITDENIGINETFQKNILNIKTGACVELGIWNSYINKTTTLLGLNVDNNEALLEDFLGTLCIEAGYFMLTSSLVDGPFGIAAAGILFTAGLALQLDATGVFTNPTNITRIVNAGITLIFAFDTPVKISKYIPNVFKMVSDTKILENPGKILHITNIIFDKFEWLQNELIDFIEEEVISQESKEYVVPFLNMNIGCRRQW